MELIGSAPITLIYLFSSYESPMSVLDSSPVRRDGCVAGRSREVIIRGLSAIYV